MTPKGIVVYEGPSALNGDPIVAIATNLKRTHLALSTPKRRHLGGDRGSFG